MILLIELENTISPKLFLSISVADNMNHPVAQNQKAVCVYLSPLYHSDYDIQFTMGPIQIIAHTCSLISI